VEDPRNKSQKGQEGAKRKKGEVCWLARKYPGKLNSEGGSWSQKTENEKAKNRWKRGHNLEGKRFCWSESSYYYQNRSHP